MNKFVSLVHGKCICMTLNGFFRVCYLHFHKFLYPYNHIIRLFLTQTHTTVTLKCLHFPNTLSLSNLKEHKNINFKITNIPIYFACAIVVIPLDIHIQFK